MHPNFNKCHNKFKLNGVCFNPIQLKDVAYSFIKEGKPFEKSIGNFLLDWFDNNDCISVKTSGSTGIQKIIILKKDAMINSSITTGNYFNLEPGNTALHCLSTHFIAGKMMLVRAMILGLELDIVEPAINPLENNTKHYDFCAMVPMQLQNSLAELQKIKTVIVGGASVSYALQDKLQDISCNVYETYGMTETITHIAVKKLNNFVDITLSTKERSYFKVFPNISISKDKRDCLVIDAPQLNTETIITNDIVKLHSETEFEILGRFDNMINSGGIKLFPEQIEAKLQHKIKQRFFIASEKDETLGDKVILVLEGKSKELESNVFQDLDTYETPKQIYTVSHFKEASTGKIQRTETLKLLS